MELLGVGALTGVAAEWLALGWLSGVDWPNNPASAQSWWAARWALRVLIGSVLVSLAQLVLALVGVGFASIPAVLGVSACGAGLIRLTLRWHLSSASSALGKSKPVRMGRPETVGWLVLGGVLLAAGLRSVLVPEAGWDAYSHWGLRAQAYALAGRMVDAGSEHEYYPPLVPLLEAWLSLHRGAVSIDSGKTVWALVGAAFGVCLSWHLRLSVGVPWLAPYLATAIVASAPALLEGFWTGQADLPLTAFLSLATLSIVQWQRQPSADRQWLMHAAVFGAAAALTKFEGFPRVGIIVAALLVDSAWCRRRQTLLPALVLALAASLALGAWTVFAITHGIAANAEHFGLIQPLALGGVLLSLVAVFGGVRTGGGLLIAALAWLLGARHLPRLLILIVLGQLGATLLAFLVSASPEVEVRTSATRLFEQFVPLALFAGAVGLSVQTSSYNRRGR